MEILVAVAAFFVGAISVAITAQIRFIIPLKSEAHRTAKQLKAAGRDVAIIRALRAGDLDANDLLESGVLDHPDAIVALPKSVEEPAEESGPRFVPMPYKRKTTICHIKPGDEVWISLSDIYRNENGDTVISGGIIGEAEMSVDKQSRLRCLEDGSLELAVGECDDGEVRSPTPSSNWGYRAIKKVIKLGY